MNKVMVRCDACGREMRMYFGEGLERGWPQCCGYTMRLVDQVSAEEIDQAIGDVAVLGVTREVRRS